jgi:hypothetical protein
MTMAAQAISATLAGAGALGAYFYQYPAVAFNYSGARSPLQGRETAIAPGTIVPNGKTLVVTGGPGAPAVVNPATQPVEALAASPGAATLYTADIGDRVHSPSTFSLGDTDPFS